MNNVPDDPFDAFLASVVTPEALDEQRREVEERERREAERAAARERAAEAARAERAEVERLLGLDLIDVDEAERWRVLWNEFAVVAAFQKGLGRWEDNGAAGERVLTARFPVPLRGEWKLLADPFKLVYRSRVQGDEETERRIVAYLRNELDEWFFDFALAAGYREIRGRWEKKPATSKRSKSDSVKAEKPAREKVDYRARVVDFLTDNDEWPSKRTILDGVRGPQNAIADALRSLVDDGTIATRDGPKNATLHQLVT